jgi:single-stranded-DNA-specific exonuclease
MKRPEEIRYTRWQVEPVMPAEDKQQLTHIHPILLQVLYNRGIRKTGEIQAFLEGHYLESRDPFLLQDMEKAVARIERAVNDGERIIVYGDFDADGVTATVLLTEALRGFGLGRKQAQPYIPDRVAEGYGLNSTALTMLNQERGASLLISVDCGIRSVTEVKVANELGLDVIFTDHDGLGPELPPAVAIINPNRPESTYPERRLAGVGIAFKLAQALRQTMPERARFDPEDLLDLVALGTVADLAPLLGENRQLVASGLAVLNQAKRPGLAALARAANIKPGTITAESIGFGLGPRINAAGRLEHAYTAARLLAARDRITAEQLAKRLNELNKRRQQVTADLCAKAEGMVDPDVPIIIAADESFLSGVVGLVASRLADMNYRPAIIMEKGAEVSRASCRSIPGFHITQALDEVADLLVRYGGHAQAAGFTVRNEHLPQFERRITEVAQSKLEGMDLDPVIKVDMEIELDDIDWALQENLARLEPTGTANLTPIFVSKDVEVVDHQAVGRDGSHLKLRLIDRETSEPNHKVVPAIAFRQGGWVNQMPQLIDVVYNINVNEWNGRRELQLNIKDIRPAKGQSE